MRSAARTVAEAGADLIDLNMGCPVPKVGKTGAGVAMLKDPDTAVAVAKAAREGSGLPVTVKLRSGHEEGRREGVDAGAPARRRGRRRRHHLPPAQRAGPPQGRARPRAGQGARRRPGRPGDPLRRHERARVDRRRLGVHRRRGDHARPRRAGEPVAVRPAGRAAPRGADARGDPRRARLGDGPRRRAPRRGARRPLPAQVLPLVRRAAGEGKALQAGAPAAAHRSTRRAKCSFASARL